MICTTTPSIEGRKIVEYKGIVFGEVISGVDFIKDFAAGLSNFFGGRSGTYEDELIQARENAIAEMEKRAQRLGADAVVGVKLDYEVLGANNGMLMVTASGTAVRLE
ncbi:MAG: putative heavy metal-binding protein [Oscillospiraceae bacterium]